MKTVFGYTFVKWPQAESHEKAHQSLLDSMQTQAEELEKASNAISASIKVLGDDLARVNSLRDKLKTLLG
jgi:hypothetical protein